MHSRTSKPSTSSGRSRAAPSQHGLEPLSETLQLGARVYQAVLNGILSGAIESGTQLRPDTIARQLEVSTTPVREALLNLESDGLVNKRPYQGWFVRDYSEQEARQMYELRAALESLAVRLACRRISGEEVQWLRDHQAAGVAALEVGDMNAYRIYNRDLHAAILAAARNSYLSSMMGQLGLQSQMLIARTIRVAGRPSRAIEEHHELIELVARGDSPAAERLMEHHIMSALEDILRYGLGRAQPAGTVVAPGT